MIVDGKGKLFGKVSIIDILIVLVVIAAFAGVGYKLSKSNTVNPIFGKTEQDLEIVFYQEEVPEFAAKAVKIGDSVKEALQGNSFGHVTDIKIGKSIAWVDTDDGNFVPASKEGYCSVYITMEARGLIGSNGVTIGNAVYYVGRTINSLYVGNAGFYESGRIYAIREKG